MYIFNVPKIEGGIFTFMLKSTPFFYKTQKNGHKLKIRTKKNDLISMLNT